MFMPRPSRVWRWATAASAGTSARPSLSAVDAASSALVPDRCGTHAGCLRSAGNSHRTSSSPCTRRTLELPHLFESERVVPRLDLHPCREPATQAFGCSPQRLQIIEGAASSHQLIILLQVNAPVDGRVSAAHQSTLTK